VTRILIVDDEETIRLALRKFLRSRGYEVEIAGSGDQALQILGKESFSLMLCDVRMPGMTGVQVVPLAMARDPYLAIIMLTAVNDAATATEVLASGASDYLMKPVELAGALGEEMGLDAAMVEDLRAAGRLHDVGKIGIRESILNKPDRLTTEEFEHVKRHVQIGLDILAPLFHIKTPLKFVEHHHEHWDGAGYPHGLAGENIPLGARILCAADTFDALTSKRAYRDPMAPHDALDHLSVDAGKHFDPDVYDALVRVIKRRSTGGMATSDGEDEAAS
jgi:putative two-component system response regulator